LIVFSGDLILFVGDPALDPFKLDWFEFLVTDFVPIFSDETLDFLDDVLLATFMLADV